MIGYIQPLYYSSCRFLLDYHHSLSAEVFYTQNVTSYNAGILTALSNRVGDVALLIAGLTAYSKFEVLMNSTHKHYVCHYFQLKLNIIVKIILLTGKRQSYQPILLDNKIKIYKSIPFF